MPGTFPSPVSGTIPATIPLNPPPLVLALVQVRFAQVVAVVQEQFFAAFQQALLEDYPLTTREQEVALGPDMATRSSDLWRMQDEAGVWRVTLAPGFVALETKAYPGKDEFFGRLRRVLEAVQERVNPPRAERLGVRYVCRLDDEEDLGRLDQLIRPEVVGVARPGPDEPALALTQCSYSVGETTLGARFGLVPAGLLIEPSLPVTDRRSWLLDVDVFDERKRPFDAADLADEALDYSRRQYRFFRWAVEPAFLLRFGADPDVVALLEDPS